MEKYLFRTSSKIPKILLYPINTRVTRFVRISKKRARRTKKMNIARVEANQNQKAKERKSRNLEIKNYEKQRQINRIFTVSVVVEAGISVTPKTLANILSSIHLAPNQTFPAPNPTYLDQNPTYPDQNPTSQ